MDDTEKLERRFTGMLARIFSDGILTEEERAELDSGWHKKELTPEQIQRVMVAFVEESFQQFAADGTFSPSERQKLQLMLDSLDLPEGSIPPALRAVARR